MNTLPDYSALRKLATALWQQGNAYHGAAVMVGAGFSRSAALTGDINRKLPLWNDLSSILARDLGASSSSDPLRLAEEYCAYFGKQGLRDLVKKEINDAAWAPGELHKSLLELPWSEVLTTNWDTLLERASMEVHQPVYNVVSKQEDLSSARSPRIVKLHGTVNVTEDIVFTQEDYRKYPQRHAAFVNFTRQVFIENELCLLGFSGDDPNFLQWSGWVRDQLATHARRIYLVGALNLTAAKRKYLESINVAAIDLGCLVADYDDHDTKHVEATRIFLQTLISLKPKQAWEWFPTPLHRSTVTTEELDKSLKNQDYAATLLEQQLPILETDRKSYPGWLVCPTGLRRKLQNQINDPFPTLRNMSEMAPDSRAKLLYEISWRHGVTYEATPTWLAQELLKICDPTKPCVLTKRQQLEVALMLLKNTRWFNDPESISIAQTTTALLEQNTKYWQESAVELAFHQAIIARDRFDYPLLETLVEKISGRDPVWKLRRASLLAELGHFDEGEVLIAEAYRELLGQYRNDRKSIHVFSRLAWAHWLLRGAELLKPGKAFEAFPSSYQSSKCNPWDDIEHIQERISKALEKQQSRQEIEPSFEPGSYKDNSNTVVFNGELHPILLLEGISSTVGMPLRWSGVSFLVEPASRLVGLNEVDGMHRFALAIRAANSDTSDALKKVFSRTQIACLPQNEADYLLNQCIHAVDYWRSKLSEGTAKQRIHTIDRLRIFIEVLARVSVRATPEQAKRVFHLAIQFGKQTAFHHLRLVDALKHLINYALKSVPDSQHHELLLDALSFPLQTETAFKDHKEWPNPVIRIPGSRASNTALDRRIDEIIDGIAPCSTQSGTALLRLLPLLKNGFLTDDERWNIAEKIWGAAPDYQELPETGLLKYVLLELPAQDTATVKYLVRKYLFEAEGENLFEPSLLMDIENAAQAENLKEHPGKDQAADYFGRLVVWRAKHIDIDPLGFSDQVEKQKGELIGAVLSRSVVPVLPAAVLTEENFDKLYSFYSEVDSPEAVMAFAYFAAANTCFIDRVEKIIRRGLQEQNSNRVAYSSYALLKWRELNNSPATARLITRLIYLIGSNRMVGLPALLWTANQMYNKGYLSKVDVEPLVEILPVIFDTTDYRNFSQASREAVSVSLLRAACVTFARDMLNESEDKNSELLRVLEEARQDALPEVRFAVHADL